MHTQKIAYLLAGIAILFWSTVATAFNLTLRYIDPLPLILYSCICSAGVLFLILFMQGKAKALFKFTKKQCWHAILLGMLNPTAYYFILFSAYDKLPAQQAMSINYSWPIMLVILSVIFMRQRITRLEVLAIVVAYMGVVVIATGGKISGLHFSDPLGAAFALTSTVIWACYWLLSLKSQQDPVITLFVSFACAIPVLILLLVLFSPSAVFSWPDTRALAGAAYVGLFEMGLTFVLWSTALKMSDTTAKVSGLIFLTPFLSLVFIAVYVGEKIVITTMFGLAIVLIGIFLQKLAHYQSEKNCKNKSLKKT